MSTTFLYEQFKLCNINSFLQTVPPNTEVLLHGNDYTEKADPGSAFGIQKQNWDNHALILKGFNNDDISFNTLKFNCI